LSNPIRERTLALAGIYQAASLVNRLAHKGIVDSDALQSSIDSVFVIDAADSAEVFGGISGVAAGLRVLIRQMSSGQDLETTRYAVRLLHLRRQLARRPDMLQALSEGLKGVDRQRQHFHSTHPAVLAGLAELYAKTLSTLPHRIQVTGERHFLTQPENVNKIRALLLAGIRAAVLLYQNGGRTWNVILGRRKILQQARELLGRISH
jgi:high frequency lysogenization protein